MSNNALEQRMTKRLKLVFIPAILVPLILGVVLLARQMFSDAVQATNAASAAIGDHTMMGYLQSAIEKNAEPAPPSEITITLSCTPVHLVRPGGEMSSQICEMPDGKTVCLNMGFQAGWACYPIPTGGAK